MWLYLCVCVCLGCHSGLTAPLHNTMLSNTMTCQGRWEQQVIFIRLLLELWSQPSSKTAHFFHRRILSCVTFITEFINLRHTTLIPSSAWLILDLFSKKNPAGVPQRSMSPRIMLNDLSAVVLLFKIYLHTQRWDVQWVWHVDSQHC